MKQIVLLFLLALLGSCTASPTQPKHLLSKDEMAEIIADLAIYEQSYLINPQTQPENIEWFILKKHQISAEDFRENYQYYIYAPSSLDDIYNKAKKIILSKDPYLEKYLREKKAK